MIYVRRLISAQRLMSVIFICLYLHFASFMKRLLSDNMHEVLAEYSLEKQAYLTNRARIDYTSYLFWQ